MKGIVIVDVPETCKECPCVYEPVIGNQIFCSITDDDVTDKKSQNCPIKPVPKKDEEDYGYDEFQDGIKTGWNLCIDEILKGE